MKIDRRFPLQVGGALIVVAALAAYPLVAFASQEVILAAAVGAVLSTVNVLLGFLTIEYSFEKSYGTFLKAVLGGMGIRMLVVLAALLVLIGVAGLHASALVVSALVLYAVFLVLEVLFIQRKVVSKSQG